MDRTEMGRGRRKRLERAQRVGYVISCAGSCVAILCGLIGMAKASPNHALLAMTGALIIALARGDMAIIEACRGDRDRKP